MLTDPNFYWGTPILEQQHLNGPLLDQLNVSQLGEATYRQANYSLSRSLAKTVNFVSQGNCVQLGGRRDPVYPCPQLRGTPNPRVTRYVNTVTFGCAGVAFACVVAGPFSWSCFGGWCGGVVIASIPVLFSQ